jgi:hypothetical protein
VSDCADVWTAECRIRNHSRLSEAPSVPQRGSRETTLLGLPTHPRFLQTCNFSPPPPSTLHESLARRGHAQHECATGMTLFQPPTSQLQNQGLSYSPVARPCPTPDVPQRSPGQQVNQLAALGETVPHPGIHLCNPSPGGSRETTVALSEPPPIQGPYSLRGTRPAKIGADGLALIRPALGRCPP